MTIITTTKQMRPRDANDFYPTPLKVCQQALSLLPLGYIPDTILDPGAGTGVWGQSAKERWPYAHLTGVELRNVAPHDAYDDWYQDDFRLWPERSEFAPVNPGPLG